MPEWILAGQQGSYRMVSGARNANGFGLVDTMVAAVVLSLLAALAVPAYIGSVSRAKVAAAVGDVGSLSVAVETFSVHNNDRLPDDLDELPIDVPLDPRGNEYECFNIRAAGPGIAAFRKDGKLNPLNSEFDLYSKGADGESVGPLSASESRDDIVRANNGAFVGLAEGY